MSWAITSFGNKICLKKMLRLTKALDNRFYIKFTQLEIGVLITWFMQMTWQSYHYQVKDSRIP